MEGELPACQVFELVQQGCYPKPLTLEVDQHDGSFQILEAMVYMMPGEILVKHFSKNWALLKRKGFAPFQTWTHLSSWSGSARGTLVGTLLRAWRNCSTQPHFVWHVVGALIAVAAEAVTLGGYTNNTVRRCVKYLGWRHQTESVWDVLYVMLSWCGEWAHLELWWNDVLAHRDGGVPLVPDGQ